MYIVAGKKRLAQIRTGELEELRKKAEASGAQEDAQAYNDMVNHVQPLREEDPRSGAHPGHLHPDGSPDPPASRTTTR